MTPSPSAHQKVGTRMRTGEEVDLALEREAGPALLEDITGRQLGRDIALVGRWRNGGTPPCSFTYGSCCQNKRKRRSSEVTLVRCHEAELGTGSPLPRHVPAFIRRSCRCVLSFPGCPSPHRQTCPCPHCASFTLQDRIARRRVGGAGEEAVNHSHFHLQNQTLNSLQ